MALQESSGCYCCQRLPSLGMDIDAALNELGMLSTVTESRRQYLQERNRTKSETALSTSSKSSSHKYKIVQIDPMYVAGVFSERTASTPVLNSFQDGNHFGYPNSPILGSISSPEQPMSINSGNLPLGASELEEFGSMYRTPGDSLELDARRNRLSRIKVGRMRRFRKPYEVPWRLYHSFQESELRANDTLDSPQSKSNSSSPVKLFSQTSLTRSRSLDNLEMSKLKLTDLFEAKDQVSERQDIENVSQHMKDLNMGDAD